VLAFGGEVMSVSYTGICFREALTCMDVTSRLVVSRVWMGTGFWFCDQLRRSER
jgi:hypothetical protein